MNDLEEYVKQYLSFELKDVLTKHKSSGRLSVFEETIIYKYSEDGYEGLNELLRKNKGKKNSRFGQFLRSVLLKLPDHKGIVYRGVYMTITEFNKYKRSLSSDKPLEEYAFISTSQSRLVAMAFGAKYLFRIWCKTGKSIEQYTKFGLGNPQNEHEVLFVNNSRFKVTEIRNEREYTLITMFEL